MANFRKYTRYTNSFTFKNRIDKDFLILRSPLNLQPDAGDVFITVTQDIVQRPDLIAFKAYGNVDLWWAIYEFNNIASPLFDLKEGQSLRIPEVTRLTKAISKMGNT